LILSYLRPRKSVLSKIEKGKNMLQNLTEGRAGRALKEGLEELLAHLIHDEWWTDGAPGEAPPAQSYNGLMAI